MPKWSLTGLQYIYTKFSLAFGLSKESKFMNGYYLPTLYQLFRAWSGLALELCLLTEHLTAWCCLLPCRMYVPGCFPVSLNIPLSGASRTHLKIIILIISLNHWLLSLFLLSLLLSLYFQIPSAWEITFLRKLPSSYCAAFTKFLPSVIYMNPSADRIPSLCLIVLNKTPIIFQTIGLSTRHNWYPFHYRHFTS